MERREHQEAGEEGEEEGEEVEVMQMPRLKNETEVERAENAGRKETEMGDRPGVPMQPQRLGAESY